MGKLHCRIASCALLVLLFATSSVSFAQSTIQWGAPERSAPIAPADRAFAPKSKESPANVVTQKPAPRGTTKPIVRVPANGPTRPAVLRLTRLRSTMARPVAASRAAPSAETAVVAPLSAAERSAFLDGVNADRASLGRASVRPFAWDDGLASFAATLAGRCQYKYSTLEDRTGVPGWAYVGEIIALVEGRVTASNILNWGLGAWWGEQPNYNYPLNACTSQLQPPPPPGTGGCTSYTQLAWAQTTSIGCAVVQCPGLGSLAFCEFGPGGNVLGQRPY